MRKFLLLILITLSFQLIGQRLTPQYSKVKIILNGDEDIRQLGGLGLDVTHGQLARGRFLINDFADYEIDLIKNAGFKYEILIEDVVRWYQEQSQKFHDHDHDHEGHGHELYNPNKTTASDCVSSNTNWEVPDNFSLGSWLGYFRYDEMIMHLDSMVNSYPNLISAKTPITSTLTHDGNPVYFLRISDNPNVDEDEPEALYTSLHHAREPGSLSQNIFFMWYLLENYDTDPEIKYLLDNTELYFIPCVNPDGYKYNEVTNPGGGGLWRKNRRDNGNGTFGVDLNRNYGYAWAFDDFGSSPSSSSDVYRGPFASSEPETQNVMALCQDHQFRIALNYHTYGNLLIHPWGYSDTPTDVQETYAAFAELLTEENNYFFGTGSQTVGYTVNGVSDDWMHGDSSKPQIYSMTPEVGTGGFWAPESVIIDYCKANMHQNMTVARLLLNYGVAKDLTGGVILDYDNTLNYSLKKYGLMDGALNVTLTGISPNVASTAGTNIHDLNHLEAIQATLDYSIVPGTPSGSQIILGLSLSNGIYTYTDTLTKIFGGEIPEFEDDGEDPSNWITAGTWNSTDESFYSPNNSYTDSPNSNYDESIDNYFQYNGIISLTDPEIIEAKLTFWTHWDIETEYDYAMVELSEDGDIWIPACGLYTKPGTEFQYLNQPVYDGVQTDWVLEEMDLEYYIGKDLHIRFLMSSDGFIEEDGFYFDDLKVIVRKEVDAPVGTEDLISKLISVHPNPASNQVHFEFNQTDFNNTNLIIYNSIGQVVIEKSIDSKITTLDSSGWEAGVYHYKMIENGIVLGTSRLVIVR